MNTKLKTIITLATVIFAVFSANSGFAETKNGKNADKHAVLPGNVPITIYEGKKPIKITLEDIATFHGDICPCVVIAFRSMQKAFLCLCQGKNPQRDDFMVITAHPSDGIQDTFDFVTRAKTGKNRKGDFKVQLPTNKENGIGLDNYIFTFKQKSTGQTVEVKLRKEVFPEGFFELKKKVESLQNPAERRKA